jgi:trk system potassium uptake protein TrkH
MYTRWYLDVIFKYIGQLIYYSSYTLLIPVFLSLIFKEPFAVTVAYFVIFLTVFFIGLILYKTISLNKRPFVNLNFVHYLAIICGFWILFSFFSALPLIVVGGFTILDSVFETMSMLTTTGLSVLPILPTLASLIFWRSILAWVGGIGLILLAYFGVLNSHSSFNKLMRAEGRELIRPNVKNTIKHLWMIYSILTIFGIILLIVFGMNLFNSINYTMAAISTTGLQIGINDALLLENPFIQLSLVLILMIGATSFLTHYFALRKKSIVEYFKDNQFIAFLSLVGISIFVFLVTIGSKHSWTKLLFLSVSAISGGGFEIFGAEEMVVIPAISLLVITVLMFVGGSTNSTSGGIKMHRLNLLTL